MTDIKMRVVAQNQASPVLQKIKADIKGLDGAAGTAAGGIGAFGKALGAAGLVAFGVQVAGVVKELAALGNQSIAMSASFEQLAGGASNATTILDSLTAASRGTISQYDLMLTANRAMLLGVADSADEFSKLMQIAAVRGRAMGLSTTQAFNDIVTGLGRMSPLILDNLGIVVDQEKTMKDYAAAIGKTADALTDAERKQALVNSVIANSSSLLEGANANAETLAGQGVAQLNTAWDDFKATLGESFAPFFDARAAEVAAGVQAITDAMVNAPLAQAEATIAQRLQVLLKEAQDAIIVSTAPGAPVMPADGGELTDQAQRMQLVLFAIEQVNKAQQDGSASAGLWADQITRIAERVVQFGNVSDDSLRSVALLLGNIAKTNAAEALQAQAESMGALSDATRPTAEAIAATNAAIGGAISPLDAFSQSFATAAEAMTEAEPALKKIYDTLLDTGDIAGAGAAYSQIGGIIQEITAEWVRQGIPISTIKDDLLPKLIGEINTLVGAQVEAGAAGIDAGATMGQGFLSAIPAINLVIQAVNALTGAANTASRSTIRAQESGASRRTFNTRGWRDNARGIAPNINPVAGLGGIAGTGAGASAGGMGLTLDREYLRRMGGIGGRGMDTDLVSMGGGSGGGGMGEIDSTMSNIASRIKSVLSGALKSGIDLDGILGREDAVEEPARRLADIAVRGFESPWVDYIKNTFPEIWKEIETAGDPKAAAASILRDFEDGLRPELLDKNRAKELVKRALLGDQNTAALAAEIAAELSGELGISLAQAQAAASSVLGTGTTGEDGAVTSSDGATAAATFTDTFIGAMNGMLERFKGAGSSAGAQWGVGFMATVEAGVPGQLIALLVTLVTPGVMAAQAAAAGRTGAS